MFNQLGNVFEAPLTWLLWSLGMFLEFGVTKRYMTRKVDESTSTSQNDLTGPTHKRGLPKVASNHFASSW